MSSSKEGISKDKKKLILISNDDGITSTGIRVLVEAMKDLGEVVVVAPDSPQSGMGHAITIGESLRLSEVDMFEGVKAYQCSGTPADCIKIAKHFVLKDRKPDLVVSGINHGSNSSISILYSGTMSAAMEAAIEGLPAIGFSVADHKSSADFSHCVAWVKHIAKEALTKGIVAGTCLNVNFPKKSDQPIKGLKICRQARAKWQEEFDQRVDPNGRNYYWLIGTFVNMDKGEDTDVYWLDNNYATIVPSTFDLTAYTTIPVLNKDWVLEL